MVRVLPTLADCRNLSWCNLGLYLLLFGLSLYVHQSYRSGKFMVAFALVLFSLLTTVSSDLAQRGLSAYPPYRQHWVLGFFRFYQAYVVHGEVPGGTFAYLGDMGAPTWVAQLAVNALARVLMDALLVCVHQSGLASVTNITSHAGRAPLCHLELQFVGYRPPCHYALGRFR